jgi:hypothetical protein
MKATTIIKPKPVIQKLCAIRDNATGNWVDEYGIIQVDGTTARVLVPREEAGTAASLGRHLRKKGARLPREAVERKLLLEGVIDSNPLQIAHRLANPGWQLPKRSRKVKNKAKRPDPWFCLGQRLIGAPTGGTAYLPPSLVDKSRAKAFSARGKLDDWRSKIAETATLSTCLTLAISAACAAPLLRLAGLQNLSLLISGPSRAGKTTALLATTSFYGIGREEDLLNWNATGARLLEVAAGFADIVLPLNEVGAKKGKRNQTYEGVRDLVYQYAEGSDRARHSTFQGEEARRFHGIMIATAEHSIADYARLAHEVRDDGELFRAIDVAAVRESMTTIFDLAPDTLDQPQRLQQLRNDLKAHHGTACVPYIKHLIRMGQGEVKRRVDELIQEFVSHMPAAAHHNVAGAMAKNFGLLYAGAILGIESGVLPWTRVHAGLTLKRGFDDALEHSKPIDALALGLEILKKNLREKIVERKPGATFGVENHPGYWQHIGFERIVVVHARQFGAWFPGIPARNLVLEWLARERHLRQSHRENIGGVVTSEDLKGVSRRWPDGSLVRSFEFSDPFPDTSLTVAGKPGQILNAREGKARSGLKAKPPKRPLRKLNVRKGLAGKGAAGKPPRHPLHPMPPRSWRR